MGAMAKARLDPLDDRFEKFCAEQEAKEKEQEARMYRTLQTTFNHMAINVGVNTLCVTTRPNLLLELIGGDSQRSAELLSLWAGGIGTLEYLLNPTIGRLSDQYGRKPFLLMGPIANFVFKGLVALNPTARNLMLERIICGALTTMSGSTTCSAVLSDLTSGQGLAIQGAGLGSYAGLGCILGPFIGGQLIARTGNLRLPFAVGSITAGLQLLMVLSRFEETLMESKPFDFSAVNPFSFVRLFTKSPELAKLVTIGGLQCFPEGKNLSDFNQNYILTHVGWSQQMRSMFTVGFGTIMMLGGRLAKYSLEMFGQRGHTTLANWLTLIALGTWGARAKSLNMWLGMLLLMPTMERRTAIGAISTKEAIKCGFTRGEFAGLFANWRAVATAVAPVLYGRVHAMMAPKGLPGAPYFVAGLVCILAEILHKTMSDEEMGIEKSS